MRSIFHVGHSKTGSTAIQTALAASRAALADCGVLYPEAPGSSDRSHKLLFAHIFRPGEAPRHITNHIAPEDLPAARDETVRSIRREIAEHRPDCLVLSSESRFREWKPRQRERFGAVLARIGARDCEIVAYIRRPSGWYLSDLGQTLRATHKVKAPRGLRSFKRVEQFAEDFGRERVALRPYDRRRLVRGDIVADFVETFLGGHGVTTGAIAPAADANESYSAEGFDLMRRFRLEFHAGEPDRFTKDGWAFLAALREAEATLPLPRPAMDPDLAERIDYSFDDLLRLRDGFGLELPDYDYARLERGELTALPERPLELHEIVRIDRAAQARVVERLRESAWAEADPARRRWLDALPGRIEAEGREARRLS